MKRRLDWLAIAAAGDLTQAQLQAEAAELAGDERGAQLAQNLNDAADDFFVAFCRAIRALEVEGADELADQLAESFRNTFGGAP